MPYELDSEEIETVAGTYQVFWILDEGYQDQPYNEGFGLAMVHGRWSNRIDIAAGRYADEIAELIGYHQHQNAYNGNIWDREVRSAAAVARYVRLKYGVKGVMEVGENYYPCEPSTDRGESFYGLAWDVSEVSGQISEEQARANVKIDLKAWRAWADGDVFGWQVLDPNGNEVESAWGYYGLDREREYTLSEAKMAIEADVADRIARSNLVGSGFVELI